MRRMSFVLSVFGFLILDPISARAEKVDSTNQVRQNVQLPEDPLTEEAKASYNAGRYNEAARRFRKLAIRWPSNAKVYQTLARAYSWASEPAKAIIAYRHALKLGLPSSEQDKIKAELDLLIRRVKKVPPKTPSPKILKAYEALTVRAKSGRFNGREGAIGGLADLLETTEVSPRIGQIRTTIMTELRRHSSDAISRWWRPEALVKKETLLEIAAAWASIAEVHPLSAGDKGLERKIDGLSHLAHGDWNQSIKILGSVSTNDVRIRFALAIALIRADRFIEAQDLLQALARGDADPRVHLLLGFVAQKLGKDNASEAFMSALENEDSP